MFTGLIREFGLVKNYSNNRLVIEAKHKPKLGDSIAVNGVCLTVISFDERSFCVELSAETRNIMAVENLKSLVHIEPAMSLGERFEGHIVQGHVDCVGKITKIEKNDNATDFYIQVPQKQIVYIIPKGSIAVDGVSLTVNDVKEESFRLTIIPHTLSKTLFGEYKVGTRVNIETDMFARYLHHMFSHKKELSWDSVDKLMALY